MVDVATTCGKCGSPRAGDAPECPFCGVIYARAGSPPPRRPAPSAAPAAAVAPAAGAPAARPTAPTQDVWHGPSPTAGTAPPRPQVWTGPEPVAARKAAAAAPEERPGLLTPVLPIATAFAAVFFLASFLFFTQRVLGGGNDANEARGLVLELVGANVPDELTEGQVVTVADHRTVFLSSDVEDEFPQFIVVYHCGPLAQCRDEAGMRELVTSRLEQLGVPWSSLGRNKLRLGKRALVNEVIGLGDAESPVAKLHVATGETLAGEPLLVVVGASGRDLVSLLKALAT